MNDAPVLRTTDLARTVGISVQQVRNYEANGLPPLAERSPSGYRRYTPRHRLALQAARQLAGGFGWQRTQAIMGAVHCGDLAEALAQIDARHAELDRLRQQLDETLAALTLLANQLPASATGRAPRALRVGAAAALVGVRVSALRFWEEQGLLQPGRDSESRYRLYDERQLRRLRIVALLRQAQHDFAAIRTTLDELEAGRPQRAVAAIERRRDDVARTSWRCVGAVATFHTYIDTYYDDLVPGADPAARARDQTTETSPEAER